MSRQFLRFATKRGTPFGPNIGPKRSVLHEVAEECGKEGKQAFLDGVPLEACRWPGGTMNERAWCRGWLAMEAKVQKIGPMVIE